MFLLAALGVVGISFVFFGDWSGGGGTQANPVVMRVADRPVTVKDFQAAARDSSMLFFLRTGQTVEKLGQADAMIQASTWQRLVITGQMRAAGLEIPDDRYLDYLHSHPSFQKEGQFDPTAFGLFFNNFLNPQGIRDERFEQAVRDMLLMDEAVSLVRGTAVVLPEEIDRALRMQYGTVRLQAVEIKRAPLLAALKPGPEELKSFYDANTQPFMEPEARRFEVVSFMLTDEQKNLEEEARKEALSALGEKAYAFTEPFYNAQSQNQPLPNWAEALETAGLKAQSTGWLTPRSKDYLPSILREVFKLTPEQPLTTDYLRTEDGYLVFRLLEVRPPAAKPYPEVESEVRELWTRQNADQKLQEAAADLNNLLLSALAEGKTPAEALKGSPHTLTAIPPFAPAGEDNPPQGPLANAARAFGSRLRVGELSRPVPTAEGAVLFYLEERQDPAPDVLAENRDPIRAQLEARQQRVILDAWVGDLLNDPGTQLPDSFLNRS